MCRASPVTTVSVTLRSGCSDVPDFSAYLRAYAHILLMLTAEGSSIPPPRLRRAQGRIDLGRVEAGEPLVADEDRKSTRLNSSHLVISYAVFCLKKKNMITASSSTR